MSDTDAGLRAMRDLCVEADDERIEEIAEAVNGVEGRTIADVLCAVAAVVGQILADAPDDECREATWLAFQALTLGHVVMGDTLSSDQSTIN